MNQLADGMCRANTHFRQPRNALVNGCEAANYDGPLHSKAKRDATQERVRERKQARSKKSKRSWLPWS
jgi:hypothetical protein